MGEGIYEKWMRANALLASGDAHAASVMFEAIRDVEPDKGSVREALGRAYFMTGRHALAEKEFSVLLQIDPVNDYAHYALGRCAMARGDTEAALVHLKLARAMNPTNLDYVSAYRRAAGSAGDGGDAG